MSHTPTIEQRPDIDIQGEIDHLIAHYPPLQHDRHQVAITVNAGVVTASGNVQSPVTRRYLLNELPEIPGVVAVNAEVLHDDSTIRLEAGRIVPPGVVVARVRFGVVVLAGKQPEDSDAVVEAVAAIPGVVQVVTSFI
ncbi:MAG: hypothetical protein H6672_04010 [Anaerolineaceae bacterium]|nr:hypothetical protein [Anaerolineaceae bacterium]